MIVCSRVLLVTPTCRLRPFGAPVSKPNEKPTLRGHCAQIKNFSTSPSTHNLTADIKVVAPTQSLPARFASNAELCHSTHMLKQAPAHTQWSQNSGQRANNSTLQKAFCGCWRRAALALQSRRIRVSKVPSQVAAPGKARCQLLGDEISQNRVMQA